MNKISILIYMYIYIVMYSSKKKNNNKKQHLHTSPRNFSPFDMMDTDI